MRAGSQRLSGTRFSFSSGGWRMDATQKVLQSLVQLSPRRSWLLSRLAFHLVQLVAPASISKPRRLIAGLGERCRCRSRRSPLTLMPGGDVIGVALTLGRSATLPAFRHKSMSLSVCHLVPVAGGRYAITTNILPQSTLSQHSLAS